MDRDMRRALIVGINDYPGAPLSGCVNDANAMEHLLARNDDGSPNFSCKLLIAPEEVISRRILLEAITTLFRDDADVALLYFSGHGIMTELGGYLVTPDAAAYAEGVSMDDILKLANASKAREVVIILDCCQSGAFGNSPLLDGSKSVMREGVSVLTASSASQYSVELDGRGLFTSLVCDALDGGGADVIGNVNAADVYTYVEQMLGAWEQRPLFKANLAKLIPLRRCKPEVPLEIIRLLPKYFPTADYVHPLDSSYEPDAKQNNKEHEAVFAHLQKYRDARLLVPEGEKHLYYAALNSKACKLTKLGQFYWRLVTEGKLLAGVMGSQYGLFS